MDPEILKKVQAALFYLDNAAGSLRCSTRAEMTQVQQEHTNVALQQARFAVDALERIWR